MLHSLPRETVIATNHTAVAITIPIEK